MTEKQRLLLEIEDELKSMTEDEKQEVLNILLDEPSEVCESQREAV